ncbi:hypothetical protein EYF80_007272 [Liparis tanakae]|uniref:Uncharacterized protein n=1 Tax=Liparis tanakae TaxID=230148 RepID=A0A4Z2IXE8_9TELE|nr:hypothetical protein EYF80_007272 [Liparis tanakae]
MAEGLGYLADGKHKSSGSKTFCKVSNNFSSEYRTIKPSMSPLGPAGSDGGSQLAYYRDCGGDSISVKET